MKNQVEERGFTQQFMEYWVERAIGGVKVCWLHIALCLSICTASCQQPCAVVTPPAFYCLVSGQCPFALQ